MNQNNICCERADKPWPWHNVILYTWGHGSSLNDKSNKLMNMNDWKRYESWRWVSIFSIFYFVFPPTVIVLTTNAIVLGIKMVSYELVGTFHQWPYIFQSSPTTTFLVSNSWNLIHKIWNIVACIVCYILGNMQRTWLEPKHNTQALFRNNNHTKLIYQKC